MPLTIKHELTLNLKEEEFQDDWSDTASMKSGKSGRHGNAKKTKKKVPKGTSDYQAAWIVDEEGSDQDDEDEDEEGEENGDNVKMADNKEGKFLFLLFPLKQPCLI